MAANEKTSKKVAAIAGFILNELESSMYEDIAPIYAMNRVNDLFTLSSAGKKYINVGDLKALAASCLTQTADKPKPANEKGGPFVSVARKYNADSDHQGR